MSLVQEFRIIFSLQNYSASDPSASISIQAENPEIGVVPFEPSGELALNKDSLLPPNSMSLEKPSLKMSESDLYLTQ